ncbi:hypothetical protein TraAM80_07778 [Trypanosoma rangeli]|uniref:Sm domain-containing protein n=1 Tax=Trypanosoma rangeli TaxID=5698 RepID=A0A422N3W3_TRYRA|nr:uncharacterized protein TraAM80_07778 [Trypanosoma rangeli]RNF00167.1 hypothetical protein TraAM80_07778 [Trypanosoma rangeli]|eukprot:RNF00167.1 hypothetical protein TraAM80_07778 [Trypanosoma rangeli]
MRHAQPICGQKGGMTFDSVGLHGEAGCGAAAILFSFFLCRGSGRQGSVDMPAETTMPRGPLPAVVIQQAIRQQCAANTGAGVPHQPSSTVPSLPLEFFRVEVETRQGYVYQGKLLSLDDDYNVSLAEATSWRDRLCDVERALLAAEGLPAPPVSPATRQRYVGSVFIRSSNLLMVRFPQYDGPTASGGRRGGYGATALKLACKAMAAQVKRQINMERQKNRTERRKRLKQATKTEPAEAAKAGKGTRARKDPKANSKRRKGGEVAL